jgi:hypothetical protein
MHTLVNTCGSGLLLLGHASTIINSSTVCSATGCAALQEFLQQHRASCSSCSGQVEAPTNSYQQQQGELQQQPQEQQTGDLGGSEQLPLPLPQQPQRNRRMGMVLEQQQLQHHAVLRNRRMGMLVACASSANSSNSSCTAGREQQGAVVVAAAAPAAAPVPADDAVSNTSKSVLVLGVGRGTAGNNTLSGLLADARGGAAAGTCNAVGVTAQAPPRAAVSAAAPGVQQRPQHGQLRQTIAAKPQQQQMQQQPVMHLLSCSTLLSPCCSSNRLGSVSNSVTNSCLKIVSLSLGHEGLYVPGVGSAAHSSTRTAALKPASGQQQQQQDQLMILLD